MTPQDKSDYTGGNQGGMRAKDVNKEIRTEPIDVGGKETSTEKLMRPQTEEPEAYDG